MKQGLALALAIALAACKGDSASTKEPEQNAEQRIKRARGLTQKLAFESYPSWAVEHPDLSCPAKIEDLLPYVFVYDHGKPAKGPQDAKDTWGTAMKMFCGANLPDGVRGLGIQSAGPDMKFDTADDLKSWE